MYGLRRYNQVVFFVTVDFCIMVCLGWLIFFWCIGQEKLWTINYYARFLLSRHFSWLACTFNAVFGSASSIFRMRKFILSKMATFLVFQNLSMYSWLSLVSLVKMW